MIDTQYETYLTGGLVVLTMTTGFAAWTLWRWQASLREATMLSLQGVGYEFHHNLLCFWTELTQLAGNTFPQTCPLRPLSHPQLDNLMMSPGPADRQALTRLRGHYDTLSVYKQAMQHGASVTEADPQLKQAAIQALIEAVATLYLWQHASGKTADQAPGVRSWHVRSWMKHIGFQQADALPGLHIRDAVVACLRQQGMRLTPRPLSLTASEYYARKYHRHADPHGPFGRRRESSQTRSEKQQAEPSAQEKDLQP